MSKTKKTTSNLSVDDYYNYFNVDIDNNFKSFLKATNIKKSLQNLKNEVKIIIILKIIKENIDYIKKILYKWLFTVLFKLIKRKKLFSKKYRYLYQFIKKGLYKNLKDMDKDNFIVNISEIYKALNSLFTPTQNVYEGVLKRTGVRHVGRENLNIIKILSEQKKIRKMGRNVENLLGNKHVESLLFKNNVMTGGNIFTKAISKVQKMFAYKKFNRNRVLITIHFTILWKFVKYLHDLLKIGFNKQTLENIVNDLKKNKLYNETNPDFKFREEAIHESFNTSTQFKDPDYSKTDSITSGITYSSQSSNNSQYISSNKSPRELLYDLIIKIEKLLINNDFNINKLALSCTDSADLTIYNKYLSTNIHNNFSIFINYLDYFINIIKKYPFDKSDFIEYNNSIIQEINRYKSRIDTRIFNILNNKLVQLIQFKKNQLNIN